MKVRSVTRSRAILTELLSVSTLEYYIVATEDEIGFWIVSRSRIDYLYREPTFGVEGIDFEGFCRKLRDHPAYFGQPLHILVGNHRAWTYIKRLEGTSPAQLLEKLQTIPTTHLQLLQKTILLQQQRIFVLQAIERDYLKTIESATRVNGIQVLDIATLGARLLAGCPLPPVGKSSTYLYRFEGNHAWFTVFTAKGDILIDPLPTELCDQSRTEIMDTLDTAYHGKTTENRSVFEGQSKVASSAAQKALRLGQVLRSGIKTQQVIRTLTYRVASSRPALGLNIVLNSARLLAMSLMAVALLLGMATGVTALWSAGVERPLEDFQHRYSTRLQLANRLEQLKTEESKLRTVQGAPRQTAALVSAFCQKAFGSLFLSELTVRYSSEDSVMVEAKGSARREATVFALRDQLAELMAPNPVTVNSLRPRQRTGQAGIDSLFSFGLTVTLHE